MAKRSFNKKARTLQPAVMKLHFAIPASGSANKYISLSHCTSMVNRRFMRQGLNWAVANVRVTLRPRNPASVGTECYVSTIPHTWMVAGAWMKSFSLWKKQQDDALADSASLDTVARFRDFKISMDTNHVVGVDVSNLIPVTLGPGNIPFPGPSAGLQIGPLPGGKILPSAEWVSSEIVIPNDGGPGITNQYELHMLGGDVAGSKAMIQGYADSRSVPQSPDPTGPAISSSWMQEMFDVGNDQFLVTNNAQNRNDELPYDQLDYPGGGSNFIEAECQGYILNQSSTGLNTLNTGPFTAPCGLIKIQTRNESTDVSTGDYTIVTVELVPGNHRGYLCETMEAF
jgi:hypothetical protein